jgi:hypothetical protein
MLSTPDQEPTKKIDQDKVLFVIPRRAPTTVALRRPSTDRTQMMKYLAFAMIGIFFATPANAELMAVTLTITKDRAGWKYVVMEGDERKLGSEKELGDYLKGLSNPGDGIWLTIRSTEDVSVDELINVLTMVKANPEGITVKAIDLDTNHFGPRKHGASTRRAGPGSAWPGLG